MIPLAGIKAVQLHSNIVLSLSKLDNLSILYQQSAEKELLTRQSCVTDAFEGGGRPLNTHPIFTNSVTVFFSNDFRAVNT